MFSQFIPYTLYKWLQNLSTFSEKKIVFTNENVTDRINKIDLIKFLISKYTRMFQP